MQVRKSWMVAPVATAVVLTVAVLNSVFSSPSLKVDVTAAQSQPEEREAFRYTIRALGTPEWPPIDSLVEVYGGEVLAFTGVRARIVGVRTASSGLDHVLELGVRADGPPPIPDRHVALVARILSHDTREVLVPWSGGPPDLGAPVALYGNQGEIVGSVVRVLGTAHVTVAVHADHAVAAVIATAAAPLDPHGDSTGI